MPPPSTPAVIVDTRAVQRALKFVNNEIAKETRRDMAKLSREVRDQIRGEWPRGPAAGGHSYRAVTSGTKGLNPTVRLDRGYRPYIGWLVFGGQRPRDMSVRPRLKGGRWFYPGIGRAHPVAVKRVKDILNDSIRKAGLG